MPKVFIESTVMPTLALDAPAGSSFADLCDEQSAPIPFSCRSANCGTCRIAICEGGGALVPPADDELSVLELFGDDPSTRRLACQVLIRADAAAQITIRVRAMGDD